jgi:Tfp pilus assembly protein PilO
MAKFQIKLTKQQQQAIIAGVLGLGGFGYAYITFFWMPVSKKIEEAYKKSEEVQAKIERATKQAARLPRLEAELVQLNQMAVEAERRLPKKKSVPEILVAMTDLAQKANVHILTFTPGPAKQGGASFMELNYPMQVKGSFHSIGKFLAAISLQERIYNVQNVVYGGASDADGVMTVTFTLVSYQYKG